MDASEAWRPDDWPRPRALKIYGERNTGTSYLRQLVARNLAVPSLRGGLPRPWRRLFPRSEGIRDAYFHFTRRSNLGWKHAFPPDAAELARCRLDASGVLFLTLTRNPYAWLLALHRRPYHAKHHVGRFEEFLSAPWRPVGREHADEPFANPIAMWNRKNAAYLALGGHANTLHCRFEDLLDDPIGWLETLCGRAGIAPRRRPFQNVVEATKRHDRGRTFDDYRDEALNERWRDALDETCVRRINAELDSGLMRRFGYAFVEA